MAQYQLVLRVGPSPGKVFPLMKNEVTIGRDINNEIVINDAEVSRKHCRLTMAEDSFSIEDLGSTNGTWINERRISGRHILRNGETVRLGDNITLIYEMVGYDADATIASSGATAAPMPRQAAPPQQQYQQPPQQPPRQYQPPPPQFGGQVPPPAAVPKKKKGRGLLIALGILAVISVCLIAFLVYVDMNCLWCEITWNLLPGCPYTGPCP
ncbi:MAG: FHA domain-containing protein [Anaerolineales bacterium]|nr:FHA domain-containing protein [Anaerolineales bacterium]